MGRLMNPAGRTIRVYVVDDDPAVVESTAFLARALGHECTTFGSPDEFLERVGELSPGCILSDLRMPGMSGYELATALRAKAIGWPMLLMSSESGAEIDGAARAHGFSEFLRKPLDSAILAAALDRACAALSAGRG
jgi:two-component system response regulator FixJ